MAYMSKNNFVDVMSKHSDEELIEIITVKKDSYESEAVEAAEDELKKRNIDTSKFQQIKTELVSKVEAQEEFNAKKVRSSVRLFNLIIDTVVIALLMFVSFIINGAENTSAYLYILIYLGYYILMENEFQKTVGKFITKTKVVKKDGTRVNLKNSIVRTICRVIIPLVDPITFLFTSNGFHDWASDTTVVKDNKKNVR